MISTVNQTKDACPYLEHLQGLLEGDETSLDWLVIAHNDPAMVSRLAEVVDQDSSAMLQVPQTTWDFDGEVLPQVVRWAVTESGVKQLLLLGHSQAGPAGQVVSRISGGDGISGGNGASQASDNESSSMNRLLESMQRVHQETERSKVHFQTQLANLLEMNEVQQAISLGNLKVHALFYMAESGTFLLFDPETKDFQPIVA